MGFTERRNKKTVKAIRDFILGVDPKLHEYHDLYATPEERKLIEEYDALVLKISHTIDGIGGL